MENLERLCSHAEHTNCYTYFCITGDFDPDTISEMLGLTPEKTWKIGDLRWHGKTRYEFASWQFGTCEEYDFETENQLMKTITPLLSKVDILREIKAKFDVEFCLYAVPTVRFDESTPTLSPSLEIMQFCCDTGTKFLIDLYVSCPDDYEGAALEIK